MTRFQNGPAAGQVLMLKRCPVYLRVVVDGAGHWDALDQLDDTPKLGETLTAYVLVGQPGMCHINRGNGDSGFYPMADYIMCDSQPSQSIMRDPEQWAEWTEASGPPAWMKKGKQYA